MSVRNGFVLLLTLSALTFLVACGGGSSGIVSATPPPSGGFSASNLNGTYVFSVSGQDQPNSAPYVAVGSFTANGSGGISGGSIDINDTAIGFVANAALSGSSSYSVGVDGRGKATLVFQNSNDSPFGSNIILEFVLQDSFHGLVIELDNNVSGSGTIDQQTTAPPTGTYAFLLTGNAYGASPTPYALAGNFAVSGTTLTGLEDFNAGGVTFYPGVTLSGSLAVGPSSSPATFIFNPLTNTVQTYDVYVIDASHLKIIEMDTVATLSGDAYSQTTTTIPTGAMAFTLLGNNSLGIEALGGFMVTDGNVNITSASTEDYNAPVGVSATAVPFTGTYAAGGAGRYALTFPNGSNFVGGTSYAAYPSSGGVLLLEIDNSGITSGAAYPQTPGATFAASQGYGLNLTGANIGTGSFYEIDNIAEFTANSNGTITGVLDENYAPGQPSIDLSFTTNSSSYGAIDSTGRYGLSATAANGNNTTFNGGFNLVFYAVDGAMFPFMELDGSQPAVGMIIEQNAAATTPFAVRGHSMYVPRPVVVPHMAKQKKQK